MEQESSESSYDNILNDPLYKQIKLNDKLTEELKLSEKLCNQFKDNLGKYYQDLQNNFNIINNILGEIQELKKKIGDLDDHNSRLVKVLVESLEERNNVIQENDKEIQEKNKIIQVKVQEKVKIVQEKDKIIQVQDNLIQQKDYLIQEHKKEIQNLRKKLKEQNVEILKIQEKNSIIHGKNIIIQEKDNIIQGKNNNIQELVKAIQEKDKIIQEKNNNIHELAKEIREKDKTIQEKNIKIQEIVVENDKNIQEKEKKIQNLERDNSKLKKEASEHQYAIVPAINYRFPEDDKYNSIKLKDDIVNLQRSLENYITKCKGNVEINISEVQKLLKKYGSNTIVTTEEKPLIKAVLQRHVIEQIFEYGGEYFDFNNLYDYNEHGNKTETNLYNQTYELAQLAEVFASERDGIDETTETLPIKLRQEVFAALGNRGFNNIINSKRKSSPHKFIKRNQINLNNEINKYRALRDPEQKQGVEDMAGEIIRKVITLFWFRIEIQEPVAEYRWFKCSDKIQPSYMEGTWEDDEINHIAVDICYFPLIECSDKLKRQIYTPARVLHKRK